VGREEVGMGKKIVGGWRKMPEFSFSFVSSVHNVIQAAFYDQTRIGTCS
jgi:hypothetical protein